MVYSFADFDKMPRRLKPHLSERRFVRFEAGVEIKRITVVAVLTAISPAT